MGSIVWLSEMATPLVQSTATLQLSFCGHHQVDNLFSKVPVLIKLACVDTTANLAELFVASVLFLSLLLILISYCHIALVVLKIKSTSDDIKYLGPNAPA